VLWTAIILAGSWIPIHDSAGMEPEFEWLANDPNLYGPLLDHYRQEEPLPYYFKIAEFYLEKNWLIRIEYKPRYITLANGTKMTITGHSYERIPRDTMALEIGNLNGDDTVNLKDFGIYAKWHKHGSP